MEHDRWLPSKVLAPISPDPGVWSEHPDRLEIDPRGIGEGARSVDGTKLSPQAHQRLTDELAERSGPTRRHISELIERARELGDLSENGDYHAAKNEQGLNEARVRQLEAILKDA